MVSSHAPSAVGFNEAEARMPRMRCIRARDPPWHCRFNEAEARMPRMLVAALFGSIDPVTLQ